MLKKALLILAILGAAPMLANCAASGSASVGEEGASGSASGKAGDGSSSSTSTTED